MNLDEFLELLADINACEGGVAEFRTMIGDTDLETFYNAVVAGDHGPDGVYYLAWLYETLDVPGTSHFHNVDWGTYQATWRRARVAVDDQWEENVRALVEQRDADIAKIDKHYWAKLRELSRIDDDWHKNNQKSMESVVERMDEVRAIQATFAADEQLEYARYIAERRTVWLNAYQSTIKPYAVSWEHLQNELKDWKNHYDRYFAS